ncbi:hypothetical protein GCM10010140_63330 [Streptosporangium pseudovulgare]|uniref:Uncharacterized protein n=1 Tax=Streptosporangium pseudovulgare TaxID=35765 RepID=A0ABQ2REK8_9ACTN|nr:hypothetical protein GCM10010140_63330 [Streptosporangium pseudovulgare]
MVGRDRPNHSNHFGDFGVACTVFPDIPLKRTAAEIGSQSHSEAGKFEGLPPKEAARIPFGSAKSMKVAPKERFDTKKPV